MVLTASPTPLMQLKLQQRSLRTSVPMDVFRGSMVTHHNTIYCIKYGSNTVHCYPVDENRWQVHSQCPYCYPGLAIISGLLTAIGGKNIFVKTNKLVSWKEGEWLERFPPMNIARYNHAVVSNGRYVIAAGGDDSETSVEMFPISSITWSTVTSLPQPLPNITATLCGDHIYAMASEEYSDSIAFHSLLPRESATELSSPQLKWLPLPCAPVQRSTLSSMCGQVIAVGGERGGIAISDIYQLCSGQWMKIGCMDTAKYWPIVAVIPGDLMVVLGGVPYSSVILQYRAVV